ncbi:MAG TPA: glycosyltransferase [Acidobacteriaceae bacterium]|nr:glycosyltransferase [Acidobacteriaceae bacterium]
MTNSRKRILFATIGSLGDLHPCLALALELKRRGHHVTIATTEFYCSKIEALGIDCRSLRPNWRPNDPELIRQCEDLRRGPEVLFRDLILPNLRDTYADLLVAASDADLMLAGELVFAAPLVAEKRRLRWASIILSPCSFLSAYDPSFLVNVPALYRLRTAGRSINRLALDIGRLSIRHWWNPVRELRREHRLRIACDPLVKDKFSPDLVLALFSRVLAQPQPDWPSQTMQPGFVFYDSGGGNHEIVTEFLAAGDAPIVFTLGSTAVHNPGNFYEVSAQMAKKLGRRAILVGANAEFSEPNVLALPYVPYSKIFPHAAILVHQGGSGTTAEAMRAGRPMLLVPYGWDQLDNGKRIERVGAGVSLSRQEYVPAMAYIALKRLLSDASFAARSAELGKRVQQEDGLTAACNAIEAIL